MKRKLLFLLGFLLVPALTYAQGQFDFSFKKSRVRFNVMRADSINVSKAAIDTIVQGPAGIGIIIMDSTTFTQDVIFEQSASDLFRIVSDADTLELNPRRNIYVFRYSDEGVNTAYIDSLANWYNAGKAVVEDSISIGILSATDQKTPYLRLKGDADSDASGLTSETLSLTLTGSATPTNAVWTFANTQAKGYAFDDKIIVNGSSPDYTIEAYDATSTPTFALSDDDVSHGVTSVIAQADAFSLMTSISTTAGGASWTGISDGDAQGLHIAGIMYTANPTDATPAIKIVGAVSDGATGTDDLDVAETVLQFVNNDEIITTFYGDGTEKIGFTVRDNITPDLVILGDADSDGTATTTESVTLALTANATPTLALWGFTSTQAKGYQFDKTVLITDSVRAGGKGVVDDSLRVNGMAEFKNKVLILDSLSIGERAVLDDVVPYLRLKGDADSDGSAITSETFALTLTGSATPTSARWTFSSTQAVGYEFDETINIGPIVVPDQQDENLAINSDADSDGGATTEEAFNISLTGNATPTLALWNFTSTQSKGYQFDKTVLIGDSIRAGGKAVVDDSLRVNGPAEIKGNLTLDDDVTDSPVLYLVDATDATASIQKANGGNTTFSTSAGSIIFTPATTTELVIAATTTTSYNNFDPSTDDTFTLGATAAWAAAYISDNLCIGGKGETATIYVSTEDVFAGTDSSVVIRMNAGQPEINFASGDAVSADLTSITVNNSDQILFQDASGGYNFDTKVSVDDSLLVGKPSTTDAKVPILTLKGDADSDGSAITSDALVLTLTANATPTNATWSFTSTQSRGYSFDKDLMPSANGGADLGQTSFQWDSLYVASLSMSASAYIAGKLVVADSISIGELNATDNVVPYLRLKGDADSDVSDLVSETMSITLNAKAGPTTAVWAFANTQAAGGYSFDEDLIPVSNAGADLGQTSFKWDTLHATVVMEGGIEVHNNDQMDASSELATIIDDETGTDKIVFNTSPTLVTSIQVATGFSIDVAGTGSVYVEVIQDNNSGNLAIGRTTATEPSTLAITDGGADNEQGLLSLYDDEGTGHWIWMNTGNALRGAITLPTDDDADGFQIMDFDDGTIGATTQPVSASTLTVATDAIPSTTGGADLGQTSLKWDSVYAAVYSNGVADFVVGKSGYDIGVPSDSVKYTGVLRIDDGTSLNRTTISNGNFTGTSVASYNFRLNSTSTTSVPTCAIWNDAGIGKSLYWGVGSSAATGTFLGVSNVNLSKMWSNNISMALGSDDNVSLYLGVNGKALLTINGTTSHFSTEKIPAGTDSSLSILYSAGAPIVRFNGGDGDQWQLGINTSDQALFANASGGYNFDTKASIDDSLMIGEPSTTDTKVPILCMKGDADSDGSAVTSDVLTLTLVPAATPTQAYWSFGSTQSAGYVFDKGVTVSSGLVKRSVTATITAVNPGTQGDGPLTSDINEISVCGTASDAVTLPSAVAGMEIFIINNGAQTLEIWPASGDDLGAGVNTATTLVVGANITFVAYNATNWEVK